jgi:hypothetical protein
MYRKVRVMQRCFDEQDEELPEIWSSSPLSPGNLSSSHLLQLYCTRSVFTLLYLLCISTGNNKDGSPEKKEEEMSCGPDYLSIELLTELKTYLLEHYHLAITRCCSKSAAWINYRCMCRQKRKKKSVGASWEATLAPFDRSWLPLSVKPDGHPEKNEPLKQEMHLKILHLSSGLKLSRAVETLLFTYSSAR